ncbi:phage tail protein [Thalassospira xianhensis]|uniref:Phage tail collar domain-containing protein n=1 Tax=Thalassospira xianhensis MCCC 1A02616 TaxID=1177929 RepID=A0A367UH45_9PROT|nr:phage tail protein [Thalassospira xianhensis]RCK07635.1 hypothetical protein TH5_00735 [Thalassospira xianhensis MCCC 1A02616]
MRVAINALSVILLFSLLVIGSFKIAYADEEFLGEIIMLPYSFCPRGYSEANGQLLQINQNQALFSLLGNRYGGDGRVTFALPKLHGSSETGSEDIKVCIAIQGIYPQRD